uniref:Uncharacterized protein n=1 Tax=Arundo donax TaxID=35708 RepID=A0A0A9A6T2_ARUDO
MIVDVPEPLRPTRAVDLLGCMLKENHLKMSTSGLDGYAKSTPLISTSPLSLFGLYPSGLSGSISVSWSRTANTEATASAPLARSVVMLPASPITRPVLTRTMKV